MALQSSAGAVSDDGAPARPPADVSVPAAARLPRLSVTVQPRTELYPMLDSVAARDVPDKVLISAAAGTGKTVLVADWLGRTAADVVVVWVALGPGDNDVGRLEQRLAGLWDRSVAAGRPVVVVLDDAHEVSDGSALGVLERFVEAAPARSTVVVVCRRTPDLPFARYALEGLLTWIGWEDLALDRTAVAAIVEEHGFSLGESELDGLLDLTLGWAAPVRLAAIRLGTYADPAGGIEDLGRYPHQISEYVVEETLAALPEYLVRFIEATSIVDCFDTDLAEQLDEASVDRVVVDRERYGVPVVRTSADSVGVRYGWHPLLRAHARATVRSRDPERVTRLHRIAAQWFLDAREPITALEHLVAAGDETAIEDFVVHHGPTAVFDGLATAVWDLLGTRYGDLPSVRYLRALAAVEQNYPDAARAYLGPAESGVCDGSFSAAGNLFAAALSVEVAVISGAPMPEEAVRAFGGRRATGSVDLDCYVTLQYSAACMFLGDLRSSERLLRQALTLADVGAHPRLVLRSLTRLSVLSAVTGDLVTMNVRAVTALDYAVEQGLADRIDAFQCAAVVCMNTYVRGEKLPDDSPVHTLWRATERHARPDGTSAPISGGHAEVAFALLQARRNARPTPVDADAVAEAFVGLLGRGPQAGLSNMLVTLVLAVLLDAGRSNAAELVIDRAASVFGNNHDVVVARAMVEAGAGRTAAALELLSPVLDVQLHPALAVRAWLLDAVLAKRDRRPDDAFASLTRALELAEPSHIVAPFLDCAAEAAEILEVMPQGGEHTHEFVRHVQAKLVDANAGRNPGLTRTEKVVLAELTTGKQLREIARDLHVSLNTVRTHTRNLYRKLEATSRAEAVGAAIRRGLI